MVCGAARGVDEELTSAGAARVMAAACRLAGLDSAGAELIRLGENALFRLAAHSVIVRIARSTDYLASVRREVRVSRWLAREGFPAARIVDDLEQPLVIDGRPVTFWHAIEGGRPMGTYGQLGAVLRELHALRLPEDVDLPPYDVFGRVDLRIEKATGIPEEDREFLRQHGRELRDRLAEVSFESAKAPVHGDAHIQNLMTDRTGKIFLIDLENFCFDHPEWDLRVSAHEYHRLRWASDAEYADFVAEYGRDLRDWSGFTTLCAIQEFKMTTWLMQNVSEDRRVAEEYRQRIAALRAPDTPPRWQPY